MDFLNSNYRSIVEKLLIEYKVEEYSQQQYRLGQPITSNLLPNLQLCLDEILPR